MTAVAVIIPSSCLLLDVCPTPASVTSLEHIQGFSGSVYMLMSFILIRFGCREFRISPSFYLENISGRNFIKFAFSQLVEAFIQSARQIKVGKRKRSSSK